MYLPIFQLNKVLTRLLIDQFFFKLQRSVETNVTLGAHKKFVVNLRAVQSCFRTGIGALKMSSLCGADGNIQFVSAGQGCQMVYFQTKNPNLGKF
jgi:hypothetical protein